VLDFATLTGAAVRSLGQHAICYMGTACKTVKSNLEESGEQVYERLVEFPLWKEYGNALKSNVADLKNIILGCILILLALLFCVQQIVIGQRKEQGLGFG